MPKYAPEIVQDGVEGRCGFISPDDPKQIACGAPARYVMTWANFRLSLACPKHCAELRAAILPGYIRSVTDYEAPDG